MKKNRFAVVLLACLILTGCEKQGSGISNPSVSSSVQSGAVSDNSYGSDNPDSSVSTPAQSSLETPPESASGEAQSTERSVPHSSENSSTIFSETPVISSQSASFSTTVESKPQEKPVVIPEVPMPSSPGTQIAKAANGSVDYSNAKYGYISACYTGDRGKCKLRIEANGETYDHDLDPNGKTEYYPLSMGSGTYKVTLFERIEGTTYSVVLRQEFRADIENSLSPFMYPNRYVSYSKGTASTYKAAEVCAGKSGTIEKISAIFVWITDNISYDYELQATVKSGYVPNPDTTIAKKKGICFDYASLMAAMLRSQGIPSRLVIGYASPDIYHAWNEVYTKETGWITPKLLLKNNGYNLMDATFYAGTSDKKKISDYISNTGNYSAVYYY